MRLREWVGWWAGWVIVAIALDLAAWSRLRHIPALAGNPGSASALALCWVHAFVLPPLFGRPWRGLSQLIVTAGTGTVAAALAIVVGFLTGLQVSLMVFLTVAAFDGPHDGSAVYHPPGLVLGAVEDLLWDAMVWSGFAAGTAVAAVTAVGLAAILPGAQRPRLSWRVALAGACASVVFLPDWVAGALRSPWREPALLVAAGLPAAVLVNRHAITRNWTG